MSGFVIDPCNEHVIGFTPRIQPLSSIHNSFCFSLC